MLPQVTWWPKLHLRIKMLLVVLFSGAALCVSINAASKDNGEYYSYNNDSSPEVCKDPGGILNGHRYQRNYRSWQPTYSNGEVLMFYCDQNYELNSGNRMMVCLFGEWQPPRKPRCDHLPIEMDERTCFSPPRPLFSVMDQPFQVEYAINSTVSYNCLQGYRLAGPSKLTCGSNGLWQPYLYPRCELAYHWLNGIDFTIKSCLSPPKALFALNDHPIKKEYAFQSTVSYKCIKGYRLVGPSTLTCGIDGMWHPDSYPSCEYGVQWYNNVGKSMDEPKNTVLIMDYLTYIPILILAGFVICIISAAKKYYLMKRSVARAEQLNNASTYPQQSSSSSQANNGTAMIRNTSNIHQPWFERTPASSDVFSVSALHNWSSSGSEPQLLPTYDEAIKMDKTLPSFEAACSMQSLFNITNETSQKNN